MTSDDHKFDDAELVKRTLAGDKDAYDCLVTRYYEVVLIVIYRIVKDHHESEDLTQDTFVRGLRELKKVKDPAHIKTWLLRIGVRLALDSRRKRRSRLDNQAVWQPPSVEREPINTAIKHELKKTLSDAMKCLSEEEQEIIRRRFFGEESYKSIARDFGTTENAINKKILKALKKLYKNLEKKDIKSIDEFLGSIPLAGLSFENMRRIIENSQRGLPTSQTFTLPSWLTTTWLATTGLVIGVALSHYLGGQFQPPYSVDAPESAKMVNIVDIPIDKKPSLQSLPVSQQNRSRQKTTDQSTQKTTADPQEYEIRATLGNDEKTGYLKVWNLNRSGLGTAMETAMVTRSKNGDSNLTEKTKVDW